jgi:hypothetical protein
MEITPTNLNIPIYRIVDYFELESMLEENKLRFSKVETFNDENEGIEDLLHRMEALIGPCKGGVGIGWETHDEAIEYHTKLKNSYFSCCWTYSPESIAMWSLYSPDKSSIRIQTTQDKLKASLQRYFLKEGIEKLNLSKPENNFHAVSEVLVDSIKYISFNKFLQKIIRREKAYNRLVLRHKRNNTKIEAKDIKMNLKRFKKIAQSPFLVKDFAWEYEKEIRGLIRVGKFLFKEDLHSVVMNKQNYEEKQLTLKTLPNLLSKDDYPDYLFVPIKSSFIESVCIDPRCPEYKKKQMIKLFNKYGIDVSESNAFGYLPHSSIFSVK